MRCPECLNETPEGQAFCEVCAAPLTGYSAAVPGEASAVTLRKLARISARPAIIPVMAAFIAAIAVFGPFGALLAKYNSRPTINAEGTNYLSPAFSAVGTALAAMIFIP